MKNRFSINKCFLAALLLGHAGSVVAGAYTITDLGVLSGYSQSRANDISNNGQYVAGNIDNNGGAPNGFLYSGGTMSDLGLLAGYGHTYSVASGVNDNGQVVGYSTNHYASRAFLYSNGTMTDLLGALESSDSMASSINNNGQVAGWFGIPGASGGQAFLYSNGVATSLGNLDGTYNPFYYSFANGINDSGQVVGSSDVTVGGSYQHHAFLYSNGMMTDLGTVGGTRSSAHGINDIGQVVGNSYITGNSATHAFLYSNGAMIDLGTFGGSSYAADINNNGQVVGVAYTTGDVLGRAFLHSNGNLVDLNDLLPAGSGWSLNSANAINDLGQIVGRGLIDGQYHAYLMTPVPVSAAVWLFGSGLLGLFGMMRKRAVTQYL
jgi:probable HAF family extracellular repeat protein